MSVKRMRIFAGPNGSGKSTFVLNIQSNPPSPSFKLGYYVNADDIEKILKTKGVLSFDQFGLIISTKQIQSYYKNLGFSSIKLEKPELWKEVSSENNCFKLSKKQKINSYIAADLAEFLRRQLLRDNRKITFLKNAKKEGYRIYLYFFATEDPRININRVKVRVAQHGHAVKAKTIEKRYYKSLENLKAAVKISDRAYLFDNSKTASVLISEIVDGKKVTIIDPTDVPNWFINYLIN
jgi:predicted ABC-type ATPase